MKAATEFDVGPLTWVKSEIDLALERADKALQQYTASVVSGIGDLTQIRFCRTHLHQVHGALTIVGLDGATQFTEAVESMLEAIEQLKRPAGENSIDLAHRALAAIGDYLDDLISGQPNQPLRLLNIYRDVQFARGLKEASATDLFFPDLSVHLPWRESPKKETSQGEFRQLLRQERSRFQRGFLSWLRNPKDRSGISEMLGAVKRIEETQDAAAARSFWWVATGFLSALAEGALPEETNVKQLCARIDLQIRRLLEGSRNVAERLMRDALYFVACAESNSDAVRLVKTTYQLEESIPTTETTTPPPEESIRRKLSDVISATEESWSKFCSGATQTLPLFKENASALSAVAEQLGHTDFRRLTQAISAAANWLTDDCTRYSDGLAMEVATAILLSQNAQENFHKLDSDFAHQVDVTVARIHGCFSGNMPQPGSEIPLLDAMSRRAQEKLLLGQVAKEIQSNLAQIEQVLDGFFRDIKKRTDLDSLENPLHQVVGALTIMRHDDAVVVMRECSAEIKRFADPDYNPQESDFESVANQLSRVGFFIDSLQHGAVDFESFVRQMQRAQEKEPEETETDGENGSGVTVEQEVERQKHKIHALLQTLKEKRGDVGLREEIKNSLIALKNDADLVVDPVLGAQTKAMLSALEADNDVLPQIDLLMASLKPQRQEELQPSTETVQISQSSNEEIDAELLGIFLEEATEVLGVIDENLRELKTQPHNIDRLTTIRRSFHTLKGSGRMVGLKDVGEAAWAIEQTLNLWLRQDLEVSSSILELLEQAHAVFVAWVQCLETRSASVPDPSNLIALAETVRNSAEENKSTPTRAKPEALDIAAITPDDDVEESTRKISLPLTETQQSAEIITLDFAEKPGEEGVARLSVATENADVVKPGVIHAPSDDSLPPAASRTAGEEAKQRIVISPTLFGIFCEEAHAHLTTLQRELSELEGDEFKATPHEMYRAAHTLAGISATVGVIPVNQLGLALEHALLRRDNSPQAGSLEAVGVIRCAIGEIELMLSAIALQRQPETSCDLIEALDALYPADIITPHEEVESDEAKLVASEVVEETLPQEAVRTEYDASRPLVTEIRMLHDEIDEHLLPIFLEEAFDLIQSIAVQLRAWRNSPTSIETLLTLARLLHTLKGSARMAGAMNLGEITHAIETRVEHAVRTGSASLDTVDEIDNAFDAVRQIIEQLQRGELQSQSPVEAAEDNAPGASLADPQPATVITSERRTDRSRTADGEIDSNRQRTSLRVRSDLIDRLVNEAGELSIARTRIESEMRALKGSMLDLTENVIRLRRQLREIEIQAESQMQSRAAQADEQHAEFDPLEFDRFTRFQELTRMMAESVNDVATVQQNLLKNLDGANAAIIAQARLNREIQQELMSVRMVPFGSLADRLYRIVRQTSKELNKRANLEIKGGQVELDRSVLDKIAAPLEHILRNAIVHGLEERDVRIARGKPNIGEILLELEQEGNEIILSFSDDGAGLDFERIRERAIANGLLDSNAESDPAHLADLIFASGFTTATEVSQIAGRGIGMDVVKTEVSHLGGRIEVNSTIGQGTKFRLYLPLTLAVTKALLVRVGGKRYAIPSTMIEQVLDLKENTLASIRDAGLAEWMGHRYPFNFLPHLMGDTQALPEKHRQYWVLLLRSGTHRISVQVDELLGNQEIVVKNIGPLLARLVGIDGATVLADGEVVLILNPVALSSRIPIAEFAVPIPTTLMPVEKNASVAKAPTVMVVDDSLTVRKITGRLLAREGYQVLLAKDGVEALEQLLDVVPDVMLVDIEMPRMDGFDLTRNIRADARLKAIPIIIITSRTAEKHRSYAFGIGVDHYLGKPYREDELLRLIADYITQQRPSTIQ